LGKKVIIDNCSAEIINKNVHKDLNNTIINYTNKFDINPSLPKAGEGEILLIIHADFDLIDFPPSPKRGSPSTSAAAAKAALGRAGRAPQQKKGKEKEL